MTSTRPVLVVEDERLIAAGMQRALQALIGVKLVSTVAAALDQLSPDHEWSALIVDVGLPDGNGLDVARAARAALPLLPIMILTGRDDHATINEAHRVGADFRCKPVDAREIVQFVQEAQSFADIPEERLTQVVDEMALECALTPRETNLVHAALLDVSRQELLARLGVSENTLKSHVKGVLKKTGHDSMHSLRLALLRSLLTH
jgi:DNA-binding NarL/FixJ family response regulator